MNRNVCIVVSGIVIALLIFLAVREERKGKKEGFRKCICSDKQAGRQQACQDIEDVNNLYVTGVLTESSSLQSQGWDKVSPGDIAFPEPAGCTDPPNGKWVEWDFTDFGN